MSGMGLGPGRGGEWDLTSDLDRVFPLGLSGYVVSFHKFSWVRVL